MTGSLSVRGDVLPVGGVTAKVEAAIEAGMSKVIVPELNMNDIILDAEHINKIQIVSARTIEDVLNVALVSSPEKEKLFSKITNMINGAKSIAPTQRSSTSRAGKNAV